MYMHLLCLLILARVSNHCEIFANEIAILFLESRRLSRELFLFFFNNR